MKGLQFCEILITLALLVMGTFGLTYFLGAFSFRLAFIVEFSLVTTIVILGFILFDRALNHT